MRTFTLFILLTIFTYSPINSREHYPEIWNEIQQASPKTDLSQAPANLTYDRFYQDILGLEGYGTYRDYQRIKSAR